MQDQKIILERGFVCIGDTCKKYNKQLRHITLLINTSLKHFRELMHNILFCLCNLISLTGWRWIISRQEAFVSLCGRQIQLMTRRILPTHSVSPISQTHWPPLISWIKLNKSNLGHVTYSYFSQYHLFYCLCKCHLGMYIIEYRVYKTDVNQIYFANILVVYTNLYHLHMILEF